MPFIYACEGIYSRDIPTIEPIEAPFPFGSIEEFETWLRGTYIPRTFAIEYVTNPITGVIIDVKKTECLGIFSSDGIFERCCQKYPDTRVPEFEKFLRGKILSHNHPIYNPFGTTLSCEDIRAWADLHMMELRVVTEHHTYLIKPINQTWPDSESLFEKIKRIYPSNTRDQFNNRPDLRHRCFQLLAAEGLFKYE